MVWSFRSDVYSVKMWFSFASVITIELLLMSTMVDSTAELVMIRSPHTPHDKSIKLTCMTEDADGVLLWMGNQKEILSVNDCVLAPTNESPKSVECSYGSSINSNITSLEWEFHCPSKDWGISYSSEYPSKLELKTRLQAHVRPEGWFIPPGKTDLYLQGPRISEQLQRSKETENNQCKTLNCTLDVTKVKNIGTYQWHVHPCEWAPGPNSAQGKNMSKPETTEVLSLCLPKNETTAKYYYCNTTSSGASLSFKVKSSGKDVCFGLLFSLCPECQFKILLGRLKNNSRIIGFENKSEEDKLWQFKKIKFKVENDKEEITIQIITKATRVNGSVGKWLLHSISSCESRPQRISAITDREHDLRCQKISNGKSTTIDSNALITINITSTSFTNLLRRMGFRPQHDFGSGVSICESTGGNVSCTCAPGFQGKICREECPPGRFGFNCNEECSGCKQRNCSKTSGWCALGCEEENYLPPYCKRKLTKPEITYSLPVKIYVHQHILADEEKDIHYEIQENGTSDQWVRINGDKVSNGHFSWSEQMMQPYLKPYLTYKIRTVLNETKSLPSVFNVSRLLPYTVENISATDLEPGIVKLTWHSRVRWPNMNWFCLKIDLLASEQKKNQWRQYPVWKLYPIKEHQTIYSGTLLLVPAGSYNISFSMAPNGAEEGLELIKSSLELIKTRRNTIHVEEREDLHACRTEKSFELDESFEVNMIDNATVKVFLYGVLACSEQFTAPPDTRIEWHVESFKGELLIDNISNCQLLPDRTYVVKVLVTNLVNNESTLFATKLEQRSNKILRIVLTVLSFFLLAGLSYCSVHYFRTRNQVAKQPIYEREIFRRDSGANPEKLVTFENSVKRDVENGVLEQQFTLLPKGLERPCEYGRLPENKYKNRYGNLIAYDDTRVMLVKNPSDPYSDYINANYVQGYQKKNAYIATQGPLPETVADFWRMVWQEEVRVICMLVDSVEGQKVMCEVYWPEVGREVEYGKFVISNVAERKFADYICRTFVVSTHSGMERRQVDHLQYTGWTDQDIPMYSHSLLEYLKRLQSIAPGPGPIVVHCSAGVGRTGCIILCDICLHQIIVEGTVDVRAEAESIYNARANMLRNYLQYTLAHVVPIQFLRSLPTTVSCRDLSPDKIQELKDELPMHMNWLTSSAWINEALRPLEPLRPTHPENVLKNRFQRFMPAGPYLVKLPRYPEYDTTSDYISAVSVDGVKMKKQYLASQLPMPSTLTDFWRLIVHENVELIVVLHNADPDDDTCCTVIPREKTVIPYPYVKVETKEILETNEYYTSSVLLLTDSTQVPTTIRKITAFTCNNWRHDLVTSPPPQDALINLWSASEKMKSTPAPTLVLCYDGFTACGLYIAMSFILQRISLHQECDVISAVQAIRRSRSDFVQFEWQFEYLYNAVAKHMNF